MRTFRLSAIFVVCAGVLLVTGCDSQLQDLRVQNDTQQKLIDDLRPKLAAVNLQIDQLNKKVAAAQRDLRIQNDTQQKLIDELHVELAAANLQLDQLKRQLAAAQQGQGVEIDALKQQIAALEEDIAKKKELIASMQQRLLLGGAALPVELSTTLEDFARKQPDLVMYDASRAVVKFKSDLLFDEGSDTVAASAIEAVKTLCTILNSEQGKRFDVIIAGHTDDTLILRAETREKHPTNLDLSVHQAMAVLNVMKSSNIEPKRLSARGFSEFRPIAENKPNKGGNPQNRRVEIYIVPEGV